MVRRRFDYGRHSRVHREQTRRRRVRRAGTLFRLLGWMLILFHLVFLVAGLLTEYAERWSQMRLAGLYLAGGLVCLGASWLINQTSWRARHRRKATRLGEEGSVLVMVLIILALVSGLVLETQVSARVVHRLEETRVRGQQLRHAASTAVWDAARQLADDRDLTVDHGAEPWARPQSFERPDGIRVQVVIRDENRWFDVNNLSIPDRSDRRSARIILRDILTSAGI